jgi:hypothetical protein
MITSSNGEALGRGSVQLLDALGRVAQQVEWHGPTDAVDVSGLARGVYQVRLRCGRGMYQARLVVE